MMVIDRATNTVVDNIHCGGGSVAVAAHPDGSVIYVSNVMEGSVAVVSTETHKVLDTIQLQPAEGSGSSWPVPIVVHPDGTYVYVADRFGPTLWAINTATHEYVARSFGHGHVGIAINPAGSVLYLPDYDGAPFETPKGKTMEVIDARTLERIATINGLDGPVGVAVHPEGTRVYVANWGSDSVSVVDTATNTVMTTIPVGSRPITIGEFISPGVPRLLLQDATARLQAVKITLATGVEGVNSPPRAAEHVAAALASGNACLKENLWAVAGAGQADPRRLQRAQGAAFFASAQTMVEAIFDALRLGWVVNVKLEAELLAVVEEVVRADRVLAAVAIDDAIMAKAEAASLDKPQQMLEAADALAKQAVVWQQPEKKASLFHDAIDGYRNAWETARKLVP